MPPLRSLNQNFVSVVNVDVALMGMAHEFAVKGDNILAEQYQTYAGFPMPKATFMGGVKMSF